MEHLKNGAAPQGLVKFSARTLSDGTMIIRYFTANRYLGELQIWAADQEAIEIIAKDLYSKAVKVMVV